MAAHLSYISSKNQLKWHGSKEDLLHLLSSMLHVETSKIQVKDNGTCSVYKADGITVNYYTKASTLQIQGKDIANKLRAQLVSQALNQTENDINQSALHTSFLAYESEQEQECQDGDENSSNSSSGVTFSK